MSIVRTAKRENPFVQIDKYFLEDNNLSFEAKGILAYVLSKPDSWTIRKADLIKKSKSGKTKIESAMLELMANGYLNWYRLRENDGTFGEWVYDVYERPEFNPQAEKFIKEGKERLNNRKKRTQKRNNKNNSEPKVDNQPLESPKVDYPPVDNPPVDNQPYSNNDFSNNDFNNIKEEEEEKIPSHSELVKFLISKNHRLEDCLTIENRLIELNVIDYEFEDVENAIIWSKSKSNVDYPYYYAGLRVKREIEIRKNKNTEKNVKVKSLKKKEPIPDWFDQRNNNVEIELTKEEKEALAIRKINVLKRINTEDEIRQVFLNEGYSDLDINRLFNLCDLSSQSVYENIV